MAMADQQREAAEHTATGLRGWLVCAGLAALMTTLVLKAAVISFPIVSGILGDWYVQAGIVAAAVVAFVIGEALINRAHR